MRPTTAHDPGSRPARRTAPSPARYAGPRRWTSWPAGRTIRAGRCVMTALTGPTVPKVWRSSAVTILRRPRSMRWDRLAAGPTPPARVPGSAHHPPSPLAVLLLLKPGYAAVASNGEVHAFGSVIQRGNPAGFTGSIVGISVTADGQGYAAVSTAGRYTPTALSGASLAGRDLGQSVFPSQLLSSSAETLGLFVMKACPEKKLPVERTNPLPGPVSEAPTTQSATTGRGARDGEHERRMAARADRSSTAPSPTRSPTRLPTVPRSLPPLRHQRRRGVSGA